ncbi:MAG: WHG domain-containing protein [Microbacterium sp.]|uniref:TetR/AcrR family transcriptional regulator n=1 Tax=Microbacterium sp. TaxID=51671 RepID=UPI001AC819FF|nr:TetR/AcrR family transcriptional regulator [Microbacterium sp.]MBN9178046.1 WHG domain-containing protein [Microbacterium sp.]
MPTPPRASLAQIIDAGREIVEVSGPAGLTMQAVAERVGVRAPSLYKKVADRDALLRAVAGATLDDLSARLESTGDDLAALARVYRAFAHEHPEAFRLMSAVPMPVEVLRRSADPLLRACTRIVGEADALDAARFAVAWVTGFLQMELAGAFRLGGDVDGAFEYGVRRLAVSLRS